MGPWAIAFLRRAFISRAAVSGLLATIGPPAGWYGRHNVEEFLAQLSTACLNLRKALLRSLNETGRH
jgi:hypothetical protein